VVSIRPLSVSDYDDWLEVYRVYAEHYQSELTEEGVSTTWNWLMDNENPLTGIVADFEGKLIGLAHFRALPNPLRAINVGFLHDLVVIPQERGSDTAQLLIDEIKSIGKREKWTKIRWNTRDDNYRARAFYDKVATKTNWTVYEIELD
jgi:GNAT superfamily N-acetyltransferase